MTRRNKWAAYLVSICLVFSIFGNGITLFGADNTSINISSVEDLIDLAEKCTLDTWSQGKKVSLKKDIDLSGTEFNGIPIFGGEFDGNGYSISGLNIEASGGVQGFFRYIEEGGIVKNLTIKGNVVTGGTKKNIGGIAGQNAGTIKDCTFVGRVSGDNYIGGLVGVNETSGKIIGSLMQGIVTGTHYVGGITGQNLGTILISQNKAKVNNVVSEVEFTLEDLENIDKVKINSSENIASNTDIGGIAGFSTGIIQGCKNYGAVGYRHIGYNVGGIVGRQSGYVNSCMNYGEVFGRKDVGGIAGQIEPYITLQFSEGELGNLQNELNKLQRLMNKAIDDMAGYSDEVSNQLSTTKSYIDSALDSTHSLVNQTEDFYNDTKDSINDLSARVSDTLDKLTPVLDKGTLMGDDISVAIKQLREAMDALEITSDKGKEVLEQLEDTLDELEKNGQDYTKAMETISAAIKKLGKSIGDREEMEENLDDLSRGFENFSDSFSAMSKGIDELKDGMTNLKKWMKENKDWNNLVAGLEEVSKALEEVSQAASEVTDAIKTLLGVADEEELKAALTHLQAVSAKFVSAMNHLEKALGAIDSSNISNTDLDALMNEVRAASSDLQEGMNDVNTAIEHLNKATSDEEINKAIQELEDALDKMTKALEEINVANKKINEALKGLKEENASGELANIKKQINDALNKMTTAIGDVSTSLSQIQKAIKQIIKQISLEKLEASGELLEKAVDELIDAAKNTDDVVESIKKVVDKVEITADAGDDITNRLQDALDTLHEVSLKGTEIAEDVYDIISDLADQPTITLPDIKSKYRQTTDELNDSLGNISDAMGNLNDVIKANNDLLFEDLKSVSDQFYVVINLLIDATIENDDLDGDTGEYHEDISDQDTDSNTQGKVAKCSNEGKIQGDVNVGGITGSMAIEYDFDPEDDVTKIGDRSLKFQYLTRAVIRDCTNKGHIISKKNYTGGIVGRMDLGSIIDCKGYGKIESTDGDYLGGIAGASYSHIKDSFAMCILSGGKNVGGIAGYGSKLTGNYAMVEVEAYSECAGAIAGNVENINDQKENYFVDRGIAGIDSISYTGKAAPISYETFIKVPHLPQEFIALELTFVADGEMVGTIPFKFGESIDENSLPQIPEKVGYYGRWPDFDYTDLTFSRTLEAVYTPYTTVIESTTSEEGKALALVEGSFDLDAVLSVTDAEVEPPSEASSNVKIWEVVLSEGSTKSQVKAEEQAGNSTYELRLLVGDKGNSDIYVRNHDGTWKKINAKKNGSYMIVEMQGTSQIFCIDYKESIKPIILLIGGLIIGIGGVIIVLKKKKSNKNNNVQIEGNIEQ